ncbi:MbnP family protein [Psychroflexus salinarum]|uniref:MbnP family protein n=1 Tax=Psychroflexus salinarum TaxID=546024 RepID=A0ABW3GM23_9FLAO
MIKIINILAIFFLMSSCSSDDNSSSETKNIAITFANEINGHPIVLNSEFYQNSSGESFSINKLKYIISNIELVKENGEIFTYPIDESYFLINEENQKGQILNLKNIPIENYRSLRFGIGVDQSNYPLNGVDNFVPTAEENQMLWSWSAGYIFFKIEGSYQVSENNQEENFLFHIGSHGTNLDNYKTVVLSSEFDLDLRDKDLIAVKADLEKLFNSTHEISINDKPDIQVDLENAPQIAENVSQMFSLISINTSN